MPVTLNQIRTEAKLDDPLVALWGNLETLPVEALRQSGPQGGSCDGGAMSLARRVR
jgi:hypothetical protein